MSQEMPRVLVVDDEPDIRELLDLTLSRMGLEVVTAEDLGEARQALQSAEFNFCLTDMRLPDGNGLDLVEEISERYPNLPTAMITAHGKVEDAVYALKMGAFDFVSKPVDLAVLRKLKTRPQHSRVRLNESVALPLHNGGRNRLPLQFN